MKTAFQRLMAMSAALVLLCVTAVAQNEKSTNSETNFGVTLATGSIKLKAGGEKVLPITLLEGYKDPLLIYVGDGAVPNINRQVKGQFFSAKIFKKGEEFSLRIKATEGIKKTVSETIYIKALEKNPKPNRKNRESAKPGASKKSPQYGVPLKITVIP